MSMLKIIFALCLSIINFVVGQHGLLIIDEDQLRPLQDGRVFCNSRRASRALKEKATFQKEKKVHYKLRKYLY